MSSISDRSADSKWLEYFILILFLLNGLLLLPGSQPFRFLIRALPYIASLGSLIFIRRDHRFPLVPGGLFMQLMLALLILNMLQPHAQIGSAIAQIFFQLAIVCPVFWAAKLAGDGPRMMRILWLVFACNAIGALVGILQIYYPDHFLPAEYSAAANSNWVSSMTFTSPSGRVLVRPPGLSDLPGGAAISGSITALLGLALSSLRSTRLGLRLTCLAAAIAGISVLYLTQVRSLTLMTVLGLLLLGYFGLQQRRVWNRGWLCMAGVVMVVGSFAWAASVGGDKVRDRFLNMKDDGVVGTYDTSRGWFWRYTFGPGLDEYPFGAGPGRWGMMASYFSDQSRSDSPLLWAEIQMTGWLYDGGMPMWFIYGFGLLLSMSFIYRVAISRQYGEYVPFAAALIFCMNANIIGASFSGPSFNTTMGLQYWLFTALLYGAARNCWTGPSEAQTRFARLPIQTALAFQRS